MPTREQVNTEVAQALAMKTLIGAVASSNPTVPLGVATKQYVDAGSAAGSRVMGNNSVTSSNSTLVLNAAQLSLYNPATGNSVVINNPPQETNNILTGGPAANGRDQSAAFTPAIWLHFYWIWNGTTLASLSSANPPSTGPTLPAGYTHWAYAGADFLDGNGLLVPVVMRGAWTFYNAARNLVTSAAIQTTEQALPTTTMVPPNALEIQLSVRGYNQSTGATFNSDLNIRYITASNFHVMQTLGSTAGFFIPFFAGIRMPATGMVFFQWSNAADQVAGQTVIDVLGFKNPNGGE